MMSVSGPSPATNRCAEPAEASEHGVIVTRRYRCPDDRAVQLHVLKANGHAWPGGNAGSRRGDTPSTSMNATDVIWEFFRAH